MVKATVCFDVLVVTRLLLLFVRQDESRSIGRKRVPYKKENHANFFLHSINTEFGFELGKNPKAANHPIAYESDGQRA